MTRALSWARRPAAPIFSFNTSLGPLSVSIAGGSAYIDGDGKASFPNNNPPDEVSFNVGLNNNDGTGRKTLAQIIYQANDFNVAFKGAVSADLPVFVSGTKLSPDLTLSIGDLNNYPRHDFDHHAGLHVVHQLAGLQCLCRPGAGDRRNSDAVHYRAIRPGQRCLCPARFR